MLLSDQILEMMTTDDPAEKLTLARIEAVLPQGMTIAEFGEQLWRPAVRDAALKLAVLSVLERRLNAILARPANAQTAAELDRTLRLARDVDTGVVLQSWWKRLDNIRRGLLVTQLATAVRNFETQVGRLRMDVLDLSLQRGLQQMAGVQPTASPAGAWRALTETSAQVTHGDRGHLEESVGAILRYQPILRDR